MNIFARNDMKKILTASQMKEYDTYTIEQIGVPSMVLMERAAYSVFEEIKAYAVDTKLKPSKTKVLIVCGKGNNGGDGLALARMLFMEAYDVSVVMPAGTDNLSLECEKQFHILESLGLQISTHISKTEYDIIVDALFGIGLSRALEGVYAEVINQLNSMDGHKIALDISSGICADTGKVLGSAFRADKTISFGFYKRGHFVGEAPNYSGKIICKNIGIADANLEASCDHAFTYEKNVLELLPLRKPNGNKGTFGKVYIYAGSKDTIGAAILCAKSAFHAGAGMVKVLCPSVYQSLFIQQLPEVMLTCYEDNVNVSELEGKIIADLAWADVIIAGPGIGMDVTSEDILHVLMKYAKVPMVLDADALNMISSNELMRNLFIQMNEQSEHINVVTPHVGEQSRLLGISATEIKADPFKYAGLLSKTYHCLAICKDARTIVAHGNEPKYVNITGNHGMATAGSGDVLSGIVGAHLAGSKDAFHSAVTAVYLHGVAGDYAAKSVGERALIATNIIEGMISLQKGQ